MLAVEGPKQSNPKGLEPRRKAGGLTSFRGRSQRYYLCWGLDSEGVVSCWEMSREPTNSYTVVLPMCTCNLDDSKDSIGSIGSAVIRLVTVTTVMTDKLGKTPERPANNAEIFEVLSKLKKEKPLDLSSGAISGLIWW
mgnify:CR=1 FL=1